MFEIEIFGALAVGISLSYMGLNMLTSYFKRITSIHIRSLIASFFSQNIIMSLCGSVYASIMGSMQTLSLILSSLTSSKILPLKKTFPALIWGMPGSLLMIYFSLLGAKITFFCLISIFALLYTFIPNAKSKKPLEAFFGIILFSFGIHVIHTSSENLANLQWFVKLAEDSHPLIAFFLGASLSTLMHNQVLPLILSILLSKTGAFTFEFSTLFILGTFLGISWFNWMESSKRTGPAKHLFHLTSILYLAPVLLIAPPLFLKNILFVPIIHDFLNNTTQNAPIHLAHFAIISSCLASMMVFLFSKQISHLTLSIFPLKECDDISKAHYINFSALEDPESAMDLVEIEQFRLFSFLPQYMEILRSSENFSLRPSLEKTHDSYTKIQSETQSFLTEFQGHDLCHKTFERFLNILQRNNILASMEKNLYLLSLNIVKLKKIQELQDITTKFVEALDAILLMVSDAVSSLDCADLSLLYSITNSRDDIMDKIRNSYINRESSLKVENRSKLLEVIVNFEKSVWLTRQFSSLLGEGRQYRLNKQTPSKIESFASQEDKT